jgi:hypothetical protein
LTSESARHALEQSFVAVRALVVGNGAVALRLEEAADALLSLESREMPPTLQTEFADLITALMATDEVSALADADAAQLALRILLFHEKMLLSQQSE